MKMIYVASMKTYFISLMNVSRYEALLRYRRLMFVGVIYALQIAYPRPFKRNAMRATTSHVPTERLVGRCLTEVNIIFLRRTTTISDPWTVSQKTQTFWHVGFECECTPGYHGRHCEQVIDACYGQPCINAGTCKVMEEGRFRYGWKLGVN